MKKIIGGIPYIRGALLKFLCKKMEAKKISCVWEKRNERL